MLDGYIQDYLVVGIRRQYYWHRSTALAERFLILGLDIAVARPAAEQHSIALVTPFTPQQGSAPDFRAASLG